MIKDIFKFLLNVFVFVAVVISLVTIFFQEEKLVYESVVDGDTRRESCYDKDGKEHGFQKIYSNDKLVLEQYFQHGTILSVKAYNPEGYLTYEKYEDSFFNSVAKTYDNQGNLQTIYNGLELVYDSRTKKGN